MIFVIPIGRHRPNTLPYAVRSLQTHTPISQLVTVGETPSIRPDLYIRSPNDKSPFRNTGTHLRRVVEWAQQEQITEWVWTHDDMFLLKDWTPTSHARNYSISKHLADYPNVPTYSQGIASTVRWMKQHGFDPREVPCGPIHRPRLVDTAHLADTLDTLDQIGVPGGLFEALYVAGREVTITGDPKVTGNKPPGQSDCVSTVRSSWQGQAGRLVRERFSEPSQWERVHRQ